MGSSGHPLSPSDSELLAAARAGDRASLGALLERHRAHLLAVALAVLGNRAEAQDAVHDALLTAPVPARRGEGRRRRPELAHRGGPLALPDGAPPPAGPGGGRPGPPGRAARLRGRARAPRPARVALARSRAAQRTAAGGDPAPVLRELRLLRRAGSHPRRPCRHRPEPPRRGEAPARASSSSPRPPSPIPPSAARLEERGADPSPGRSGELYRHGRSDPFLSGLAEDLVIVWSSGATAVGRAHLAAEIASDLDAGVRLAPQRLVASGGITVGRGQVREPARGTPPTVPQGPPWSSSPGGGRAERMHLHLAPRPPVADG